MNNGNQNQNQGQVWNQNQKQGRRNNRKNKSGNGSGNRNGNTPRNQNQQNREILPNAAGKLAPAVTKKGQAYCNNCNMNNHNTADCRRPVNNNKNIVRSQNLCIYCESHTHDTKDCKNQKKRDEYNQVQENRAIMKGKKWCMICEKGGHSSDECNKGEGNFTEDPTALWCMYCNTREHITARCVYEARKAEYYKSNTVCSTCGWKGHERNCNNPRPSSACSYCHRSGHISQHCTVEQADPEKVWCKFCNCTLHSTLSCKQKDPQRRFHTMGDSVDNTCKSCHYKGHQQEACTNPLPQALCEVCAHQGHSRSSCPVQESKKRLYASFRSQVHKELNGYDATNPGIFDRTQTLRVPSNLVLDMSNYINGGKSSHVLGQDLRPTFHKMLVNQQHKEFSYYHMPWAVHCLDAGFRLKCGYEGCHYDCRIVDQDLNTIMIGSCPNYVYNGASSENPVFLETTCSHTYWSRSMLWTRVDAYEELIAEAAKTLVKFSANGELEVDKYFFDCAEMTEEMIQLKNIAILKTQKRRESINKMSPGTIPNVVDEVDSRFDNEAGQDTIRRTLDEMDLDFVM